MLGKDSWAFWVPNAIRFFFSMNFLGFLASVCVFRLLGRFDSSYSSEKFESFFFVVVVVVWVGLFLGAQAFGRWSWHDVLLSCLHWVMLQFAPRCCFPKAALLPTLSLTPRRSARLLFRETEPSRLIAPGIMPPGQKTIVEYAKSSRSSCKKCFKTIDKNAVRVGSVSRDSRGFDMTSWFHSECFRFGEDSVASPDAINGFASLKVGALRLSCCFLLIAT